MCKIGADNQWSFRMCCFGLKKRGRREGLQGNCVMNYTNRTGRRVALIRICYESYDDMSRNPVNTWTGLPRSAGSSIFSKIMYLI